MSLKTKATDSFLYLSVVFVSVLLISNVLGPKLVQFGSVTLPAGILFYPISYFIAMILSEIWGFYAARKVIYLGLACNLLMALLFQISIALPPATDWPHQDAYATVLGISTRGVIGSITAFFISDTVNALLISISKVMFQGRAFAARAFISMCVAELLGTAIVVHIVFLGVISYPTLVNLLCFYYLFKVAYNAIAIPFLHLFVVWLKNKIQVDVYEFPLRNKFYSS